MSELQTRLRRSDFPDPQRTREDWIQLLGDLVHEVRAWLPQAEWSAKVIEKEEPRSGRYRRYAR